MASTHSSPRAAGTANATLRAIDGVPVPDVVSPGTPEEVAELLASAAASGRTVVPVGGGTKLALGNVPERIDIALSTLRLNAVHHYEPTDLTLSVGAGARFATVQALLAERGQTLPVESPGDAEATIGGLIATALAGPRRFGSGTLRDLLIGISVAYPNGTLGKAGGMVVKNVTGFDLMRLHLGALGTLGVIISANFKVLPAARSEATVLSEPATLANAFECSAAIRAARLAPISLELFSVGSGWRVAARFEGRAETVAIGAAIAARAGFAETLVDAESRAWWRAYVDEGRLDTNDDRVRLRLGVNPKLVAGAVDWLHETLSQHELRPDWLTVSAALGQVFVTGPAGWGDAPRLALLQAKLGERFQATTIMTAPAASKAEIDVWGVVSDTIDVMRALKNEFDPHRTLNPGRYAGRL
jgi:glycolate oxidase FAD binding subunit